MNYGPAYKESVQPEKNVRPFIIKAIQAIVQGRSGAKFQTSCLSNVGARNNMMINVEDDPDIGSTIKQNLGSTYAMCPGDRIQLAIILRKVNCRPRVTIEIWEFHLQQLQFSLSTDDVFVRKCQTRFLERLSTLLKSILVTSRLLPAYRITSKELSEEYQNCYSVKLLASDMLEQQPPANVGSVGLDSRIHETTTTAAVAHVNSNTELLLQQSLAEAFGNTEIMSRSIGSVFTSSGMNQLHVRVHFRKHVDLSVMQPPPLPQMVTVQPNLSNLTQAQLTQLQLQQHRFLHNEALNVVIEENDASVLLDKSRSASVERSKSPRRPMARRGSHEVYNEEENLSSSSAVGGTDTPEMRTKRKPNKRVTSLLSRQRKENLHLKIARISHMAATPNTNFSNIYAEVKECDLEMFRRLSETGSSEDDDDNEDGDDEDDDDDSSSSFDEEDLIEELERHEGVLKEFDDFVAYFHPDNLTSATS